MLASNISVKQIIIHLNTVELLLEGISRTAPVKYKYLKMYDRILYNKCISAFIRSWDLNLSQTNYKEF